MEKCMVCGKLLTGRQLKYCSKKCMGLGKQGYKTCVVCGKKFKEWEKSDKKCCSLECSKTNRIRKHKDGIYENSIQNMHIGFSKKIQEITLERHWLSRHWVIQSPGGRIYECDNLLNFIRGNPDLFEGTVKQAFDGFQKIRATMEGKRIKNPSRSWKGWKLISCGENEKKYKRDSVLDTVNAEDVKAKSPRKI